MISSVIITHGDFGARLLAAAEMIVGSHPGCAQSISIMSKDSLETVRTALDAVIKNLGPQDDLVIFTDILGGTPTNVAFPATQKMSNTSIITGVNLNMVIAFLSYREKLPLPELTAKIVADGKKAISDLKSLFASSAKNTGNGADK